MGEWGYGRWSEYGWGRGEVQGTLDAILPAITFEGQTAAHLNSIELQPIQFEGITSSLLNSITLPFPTIELEMAGYNQLNISLPAITVSLTSASMLQSITLPMVEFEGLGAANLNAITLPAITTTFRTAALLTISLPPLEASFESTEVRMQLNVKLPYIRFAGTTAADSGCTLEITLPVITASFEGGGNIHGNLTFSLPAIEFYGAITAVTPSTVVMSTRAGEVTEYTSYPFNSFAKIGSRYFGASAAGIIELTGSDDLGVDISASFQTGEHDAGVKNIKWVPNVIAIMKTDGSVLVNQVIDGTQCSQITVPTTASAYMAKNVKTDKGPEGMNVGVKVANVSGSAFEVSSLEALPEFSRRLGE